MNQNNKKDVDCYLIPSDDDEDYPLEMERERETSFELENSFEWPQEEKPLSTKLMKERDEKLKKMKEKYAEKRKAKKAKLQAAKTMTSKVSSVITVFAYKGDLCDGLCAAQNLELWRPFRGASLRQIFKRLPCKGDRIIFEQTSMNSPWYSFLHSENHLEVKLQCIKESLFELLDVEEIEQVCDSLNLKQFGLETSEDYKANNRNNFDDEESSIDYDFDNDDADDEVEFVETPSKPN